MKYSIATATALGICLLGVGFGPALNDVLAPPLPNEHRSNAWEALTAKTMSFHTQDPNPAIGANSDWAPLVREYQACSDFSPSYFSFTVCTAGAMDRALHPTYSA